MVEMTTPNATIAIIGAGFAGLRAARRLEELKISYVIFEGSNRIGGRVFPFQYSSGYLQYGAEYVNGVDNEIYEIVQKNNLLAEKELDYEATEAVVNGKEVAEDLLQTWYKFETRTGEKIEKEGGNRKLNNQSVSERIEFYYDQFISQNVFLPKEIVILNGLKNLFKNQYQLEFSAKGDDLCLKNFDIWDSGVEKEWSLNKIGFKTVLDKLMIGTPNEKILLNSKVINIDYSGQKVRLQIANSPQTQLFDSVIVTSSIGYLKKQKTTLFSPNLASSKSSAIDQLGYGNNMKIFLEYDKPWWPKGFAGVQISQNNSTQTKDFQLFQPSLWAENILVAWLAGDGPVEVSKLTDDQLIDLINNYLFTNLKTTYTVSKMKKLYRHNWISDEFSLGSYSYMAKNACQEGIFEQLAAPILKGKKPVICFAGEHTDTTMYQTTVGAARSGLREADRIFKYYSSV